MLAFLLYNLYIISYFLHIPNRLAILGDFRFDLILVVLTAVAAIVSKKKDIELFNNTTKVLLLLLVYIFVSLPFVEWPGTVLKSSLENLAKVLVFYFFTVLTVTDHRRFGIVILIFAACQTFRVLEPLYLHLTTGYWGDRAFIDSGSMMNRLAGAPFDTVNPNGLAYVCLTAFPFVFYLSQSMPKIFALLGYSLLPAIIYALVLTGSRSGLIGFIAVLCGIIFMTRKRVMIIAIVFIAALIIFPSLDMLQKERYFSIYRDDVRGANTAQLRIDNLKKDFEVVMNRPLFGHGLGTSLEANFNIGRSVFLSHNLILEVWQEVGFFGLMIFLYFIFLSIKNYRKALKTVENSNNGKLLAIARGIGAWLIMNVVFAVFSYGLSMFTWYIFGGLSAALLNIAAKKQDTTRSVQSPRILRFQSV